VVVVVVVVHVVVTSHGMAVSDDQEFCRKIWDY
jgi:hypothetical protein